jgi:uncharacterized protein
MRHLPVVDRVRASSSSENFHVFRSGRGQHLLVIPHSRIYDLPASWVAAPDTLDQLAELTATLPGEVALDGVVAPAAQAISLNVSSSCNLSCTYCYASRGNFGGIQAEPMSVSVAERAVEALLSGADRARPATIGFLGGEPFTRRELLHHVVHFTEARARELGQSVRFSVTTNGTLLNDADRELLRRRPFAVTISVDGQAAVQDAQRPRSLLRGSFEQLVKGVRPLLEAPGAARISARATVVAPFSDLQQRFQALVELGFEQVGFSPLRTAPNAQGALQAADWPAYLDELLSVAVAEAERAKRGESVRLSNLLVALDQLRRGSSSPYACGAGGGYFSVASDGAWYACHRAVGNTDYWLGDSEGLDASRRSSFLRSRHVHAQQACQTCFARYLCSGGCHHEADTRSDSSCGFVRGWLEFCLATFCEIERPHEWRKS